jgi:hypothetical protein
VSRLGIFSVAIIAVAVLISLFGLARATSYFVVTFSIAFFGLLPTAIRSTWYFLLARLSEVSRAIRG